MAYITDAAKEYAKKKAKDAKHSIKEIEDYLNQNKPSNWTRYIFVEPLKQNNNDYVEVSFSQTPNQPFIGYIVKFMVNYDEDSSIENLSMLDLSRTSVDDKKETTKFGNQPLSKIFKLLVDDVNEPDEVKDAANILFTFALLLRTYLRKSKELADKFDNVLHDNGIIGAPGVFDLESARFDFNDSILDIKSFDDARQYILDYMLDD